MTNLIMKIWFANLPLRHVLKLAILENLVSIDDFWNYKKIDYIKLGINLIEADEIEKTKDKNNFREMCEYLVNEKIEFILYNETDYPEALKNIYYPPVGIFIKGKLPNFNNSIAVIGARKASDYGKTAAYKLTYELASHGIVVVSGMARGIDSCSHRGSIDGNGVTVAVMGSGFKNIYPKENADLVEEIVKKGCIITEYMPDMMPLASNFPARNRIISGLARFLLVIEAGEKSGSLITVGCALEQGKDVFAVPGNIFSYVSCGTNKLIQDGAKPITCVQDILEEFNFDYEKKTINTLDEYENAILNLLKIGGMKIDEILENSSLNSESILTTLSKLECRGLIKRVYGNYYMLY
ncbi:MAG: dprA [Clostridiales bacterium]|nr:dprA [Clostridiales bacterium]